ncbi:MAG: glycosyltransferase family 2 protein [Hyphomonas sp.]|uniref:glycosyltransferase n=1 Tax=Hyphomonas sp. TaxID=87 RepID=UPI003527E4BC
MSSSPFPTITALVVSYHTGPRLHECLYALKGDPDVTEIIIVDNGNPPEEQAWLDRFAATTTGVSLIRDGTNPGFGAAMNRAADVAMGEMLLACNPDCVIKRGAMVPLVEASRGAPTPAIVGGRIFDLTGREERGARRNTLTLWNAIGLGKWALDREPPPAGPIRVGAISGAFFLIHRADFEKLGGFDAGYFLHVEDVDLCRRAIEAGGSVTYQPLAGALHYGSTSDAPSPVVQAHKADSLKRYFRKFARTPLEKAAAAIMVPLIGLALRLKG